ncbi:fimbrial protein [Psychrobacter sp. DAB_AL32B]|uniref:fimbrial protein n=1 Tax=Psychrobacter sp. DAB_AL32B TaxID=1028414 RepID=UPI000B7F1972|nr:fimbrial protein [Psychrobacter sp. DAB_AL32B]OXL18924.1 fimbrial protein [Psychrobacter sp. DAB_AL32B]QBQ68699.1 putative adhesin [Psychrobacter sp. DAB_AL32B]
MNYKVLNGIFLLMGCAFSSESYAVCTPEIGFKSVDIRMDVGRVVVKPSDAVGTVLRRASFPIAPNGSTITCNTTGGTIQAILSKYPSLSPAGGASVYNTNIKGIGIRLYRDAGSGSNFSGYYPYSRPLTNGKYTLGAGFFVVEIVKTATSTGSGALSEGRYSSYYSPDDVTKPFLTSTVYGNAITIASSSCELLGEVNKTVQLPTVSKSGFKGVGSTQGTQAFDLNFLCNGGENLTAYQQSNEISLNFDYTAAANTTNVLANSAPASTRAKGVGVQLKTTYNNNSKIIAKNEKLKLGTVKSNQNIQYNFPLSASYYQTDAVITPGKVSSVATVTIQYE